MPHFILRTALYVSMLVGLVGFASSFTPSITPAARAATANVTHCTNWPTAMMRDASTNHDLVATIDNAYVPVRFDHDHSLTEFPITQVPSGPNWRVLVRPSSPFAIFYTTDQSSGDDMLVDDDNSPPNGQYHDADSDSVPDYVERIDACLNLAHQRYKAYYQLDYRTEKMS